MEDADLMPAGDASEAAALRQPRRGDATREKLLRVAYKEFARHGFAGARVDRITKSAKVNPRMIYHYFGSKDELYRAVLVHAYEDIRSKEADLNLESMHPIDGILALFDFTFEHFAANPQFISLLTNENLMRGKFVLSTSAVTDLTSPLRRSLEKLVSEGIREGVLARDLTAVQMYVTIASLSWFHLSNAYTLSSMFGQDLTDTAWRAARKATARKVLVAYLLAEHNSAAGAADALPSKSPKGKRRTAAT